MTLTEMTTQRDALLAARFRGVRTVEIEGKRVTYATDAEMAVGSHGSGTADCDGHRGRPSPAEY